VYLRILSEHTSVEDWYYSAASLSPTDKTLNPKLSFSSDHVNTTGKFTHPGRNFWLQDEISNTFYSYSTVLTVTLFSQRRLWRQKGVRFSKVTISLQLQRNKVLSHLPGVHVKMCSSSTRTAYSAMCAIKGFTRLKQQHCQEQVFRIISSSLTEAEKCYWT